MIVIACLLLLRFWKSSRVIRVHAESRYSMQSIVMLMDAEQVKVIQSLLSGALVITPERIDPTIATT